MRRQITFACEGAALFGSIDDAPGTTGLLIVSGGNEGRAGAWAGHAHLAARIAGAGFPVLRFDRRGVGDSEGLNGGFETSAPDITAALAAFRREVPGLQRIVAMGNCDAASALMLMQGQGCDALVLSNPWTFDPTEAEAEAMPPSLVRAHYLRRLADPRAVWRLLSGGVKLGQLLRSLQSSARRDGPASNLAQQIAAGLAAFPGPAHLLIAGDDRTGQAFLAGWDKADPRLAICPHASHSFAEPAARVWLEQRVLAALA